MEIKLDEMLQQMINWRRFLHAHPELSYEECQTSKWLQEKVQTFGDYRIQKVGRTSFIATIDGCKVGSKEVLAFRTDMDGLPIQEETALSYQSIVPGVMHACGHDFHMAMLLGLAEVLGRNTADFSNRVKLVFQSAEEVPPGGGVELVNSGYLDDVDFIYGFHIFPNHPVGHVGIASGAVTASQDIIELEINGRGSHGATPELSIDPIAIGAQLINSLNQIVSRNISPFESAVISFGQFSSGDIFNIIPDRAVLKGNVRTTKDQVRALVKQRVEEVVKGICQANHADYQLNYLQGYGPVINDLKATAMAERAVKQALGVANLFSNPQKMVSEDFSEYTARFQGCFMILGGGEACDGYRYMNHHPKFIADERAMLAGLQVYLQLIEEHSQS